jgi:hypothetical protein
MPDRCPEFNVPPKCSNECLLVKFRLSSGGLINSLLASSLRSILQSRNSLCGRKATHDALRVHWASGVASLIYDIPIFRVPLFLKKNCLFFGKKTSFRRIMFVNCLAIHPRFSLFMSREVVAPTIISPTIYARLILQDI